MQRSNGPWNSFCRSGRSGRRYEVRVERESNFRDATLVPRHKQEPRHRPGRRAGTRVFKMSPPAPWSHPRQRKIAEDVAVGHPKQGQVCSCLVAGSRTVEAFVDRAELFEIPERRYVDGLSGKRSGQRTQLLRKRSNQRLAADRYLVRRIANRRWMTLATPESVESSANLCH